MGTLQIFYDCLGTIGGTLGNRPRPLQREFNRKIMPLKYLKSHHHRLATVQATTTVQGQFVWTNLPKIEIERSQKNSKQLLGVVVAIQCHTFLSMLATTYSILSTIVHYRLLTLSTVDNNYVKYKLQFDRIYTLKLGSTTNT